MRKYVRGNPDKLVHFKKGGKQPTPEAKKAGWDARRERLAILDELWKLRKMSMKQIRKLQEDIVKHQEKHTLLEVKLANYITSKSERLLTDWLDRHLGRAPQQIDVTTQGESLNEKTDKLADRFEAIAKALSPEAGVSK